MKNFGTVETRKVAHSLLIALSAASTIFISTDTFAKEGKIITGNNGTKWCCVGGVNGDTCNQGSSTIPNGADCDFALRAALGQPIGGIIVKGGGKNPGGKP
jgi:hypothetical protein